MDNTKSNRELAVETTLELIKSWNSPSNTQAIEPSEFPNYLNTIYDAISAMTKR